MRNQRTYWNEKTALVTGGSSGIGLAIAVSLVRQGASVWMMARHTERLERALANLKCEPSQMCGILSADVSDATQVNEALEQITSQAGVPDLVVNSAGVAQPGYFLDLSLDVFQEMMATNYFGTVNVSKAVLPGMAARRSGHIINIASLAAVVSLIGYSAYGASKYAVRGFSDVLRAELKPMGIRVSIVYPPDTDTPQLEYENRFKPPETKEIVGMASVMSPQAVAEVTLREAAKGRYVILPGWEAKFLYHLIGIAGNAVYPVMDWLVQRARRKLGMPS